jgi:hypothetical protein
VPVLILFDHGTPKGLIRALSGRTVHTAQAKGWDTLSNGALVKAAEEAGFEVLLATDRRIRYQQNLRACRIAPVVLTRQHQMVARSTPPCATGSWARRGCCASWEAGDRPALAVKPDASTRARGGASAAVCLAIRRER